MRKTGESEDVATATSVEMAEPPAGKTRNGVALLPVRPNARPVTTELIRQLDEELEWAEFLASNADQRGDSSTSLRLEPE